MRRIFHFSFFLLAAALLGACAGQEEIASNTTATPAESPTPSEDSTPPGPPAMVELIDGLGDTGGPAPEKTKVLPQSERTADPLYQKAVKFDRYLAGKLELEDAQALIKGCHSNPSENLFCFSVTNFDLLEEKLRNRPSLPTHPRSGRGGVRPKFKKKKLANWAELKFASVAANLKGMGTLSPAEILKIKQAAVNEKKCPNNAAIAVAATLEDALPDRIEYEEIARLYEKGADCITENPADRENLLTRAGLFYYAGKNYRSASRVLWRSANTEQAFAARALYWLYKARTQLKETNRANQALELLKTRYPFSFHTLVALTAQSKDPGQILSKDQPVAIRRSQKEPTVNGLIEQVEVLHRLGFEKSAARVLDWAINDFEDVEPELKVYLAELKKDQGDYRGKITILSDILYKHPSLISRRTMELYFPRVLFPIFEKNSAGIDPYLLLAIARRESAFNHRAISSAKAQGLLQVMPATGRKLSRTANLLNPEDNIQVGSRYVTDLLKKVGGQIHLALAAYNAGPHRMESWTRRYEAVVGEPILFIDIIPYRETREYVASVLRNYYWYRRIHQNDDKINAQELLELATVKP